VFLKFSQETYPQKSKKSLPVTVTTFHSSTKSLQKAVKNALKIKSDSEH
jgi:hypothetical protein